MDPFVDFLIQLSDFFDSFALHRWLGLALRIMDGAFGPDVIEIADGWRDISLYLAYADVSEVVLETTG